MKDKKEIANSAFKKIAENIPDRYNGEFNPSDVIQELESLFKKYLYLAPYTETVLALWVLHTYGFENFEYTPRLFIYSPEPRCGKSTLLDLLELLCYKSIKTENVSAAAVYRLVEDCKPTLLIDEADTFLKGNEDLRSVINSGFKCNGCIIRMDGLREKIPVTYSCFTPCAIAGIGKIHQTILDRSIIVHMKRGLASEIPEKLRIRQIKKDLEILKSKCISLMSEVHQNNNVIIPEGLNSRQENSWEVLLTIAEHISDEYAEKVREIARIFSANSGIDDDVSIKITLLQDIKKLFEEEAGDRDMFISSQDLCQKLASLEEQPWCEFNRGKAISPRNLASLLKSYDVFPTKLNFYDTSKRGYFRKQFEDVFCRYLFCKKSEWESNPTGK